MKYIVYRRLPTTEPRELGDGLTLAAAKKLAKGEAKKGVGQVYISWYRASDGQTGYLNRDGGHAITGKAW